MVPPATIDHPTADATPVVPQGTHMRDLIRRRSVGYNLERPRARGPPKKHLLAQPARPDGRDPAKITGRFRADFRLAIMMVCARRAAAMQLGSGLPDASIRGLRLPLPSTRDSDGS